MDIEPLVVRLIELSKDPEVETYTIFKEMGGPFENDKTIEYDNIENTLRNSFMQDIEDRLTSIFNDVNLRDFNFEEIGERLTNGYHSHWNSRSLVEIQRDNVLGWQYHAYVYQYEHSEKYKSILTVQKVRILAKEEIKLKITEQFKFWFVAALLKNQMQQRLRQNSHYENDMLLKAESEEIFLNRDIYTMKRDTFGYIDFNDYKGCAAAGLKLAIDFVQINAKNEITQEFLGLTRERLKSEGAMYAGTLEDAFYDFNELRFKDRSPENIAQDNAILLDFETCLTWQREVVNQIKDEYPTVFGPAEGDENEGWEEEDDFDNSEWSSNEDSNYSKYGGYNGYDDDTIDDAFEGDPMNTWNVD